MFRKNGIEGCHGALGAAMILLFELKATSIWIPAGI
jgi:hypothetical protein